MLGLLQSKFVFHNHLLDLWESLKEEGGRGVTEERESWDNELDCWRDIAVSGKVFSQLTEVANRKQQGAGGYVTNVVG